MLPVAVAAWMEQVLLGRVGHGLHAAARASPGSDFVPVPLPAGSLPQGPPVGSVRFGLAAVAGVTDACRISHGRKLQQEQSVI